MASLIRTTRHYRKSARHNVIIDAFIIRIQAPRFVRSPQTFSPAAIFFHGSPLFAHLDTPRPDSLISFTFDSRLRALRLSFHPRPHYLALCGEIKSRARARAGTIGLKCLHERRGGRVPWKRGIMVYKERLRVFTGSR